ncbi:MAG: PilT protein [uncultured bacterium]|uniref:PIN domain-containing protein n=1 Tax=Candidatus Woesebacteria bacterium RIFCSPHIGHO2_12_FULL_41_24 TaxID=1802510 RepID=A0A1F8AVI4_9BACT|nr:MAG: PilT protein [uncultured bacterium]OGM14171.1 MAG: hypothetical protein A2W15_03830 [Candidatus Woesebacteria bacterium RBG_16_41_13]OGM28544.1 MAG: hypothetical protein A2873_02790 [Candidatus Woesebacteria bacterium RIFCSPHIGHO2_01_FULL_42_80]OGM35634.1 MAG: hypothetical protein A3D84_03680 [Candidatus Woesebacteria bacterium RIFCSPHIGHO2_02_FULL_42_20]OGM55245.1 MAG: hypothetical protein A3E44_03090 [Candidatus Woesebacteria bacterium RIFCSPHIGHO2_12_FULL_41_24]OGM67199.1 MAG: hypot
MITCVFDTNVLLRLFLRDIESQFLETTRVLKEIEDEKSTGKLSALVVAETIWTFESVYKLNRKIVIEKLLSLVALKNIKIIEVKKDVLVEILKRMIGNKLDFVDVYLSKIATKKEIFSFDRDFKKLYR